MFVVYCRENEACLCGESGPEGIVEIVNEHPRTSLGWTSLHAS